MGRHRLRHLRAQGFRRHGRRQLLSRSSVGSLLGAAFGAFAGYIIYTARRYAAWTAARAEDERRGADLAVHKIGANPEEDVRMGRI